MGHNCPNVEALDSLCDGGYKPRVEPNLSSYGIILAAISSDSKPGWDPSGIEAILAVPGLAILSINSNGSIRAEPKVLGRWLVWRWRSCAGGAH